MINLKVTNKDGKTSFHAGFKKENTCKRYARNTVVISKSDIEDDYTWGTNSYRDGLMCIEAHLALRNHIFVTSSEIFSEIKRHGFYESANIHSPGEVAKLLGTFLRSRELWLYEPNFRTSPSVFYDDCLKNKIPNLETCFKSF